MFAREYGIRPWEIDDLTYYIEYFVKGRGEVTRSECEFYYGAGDTRCAGYPAP